MNPGDGSVHHTPHPTRFSWDFWYKFEPRTGLFHVWYLNADAALVEAQQHHFHSRVGYAVTPDFQSFDWIDDAVLEPDPQGWDNGSIWTGDVRRWQGGWLMAYTGRDAARGDGMTQSVGFAFSADRRRWERMPDVRIDADARWYEEATFPGDGTVHAWRDPAFARLDGEDVLLVAAKSRRSPPGDKGAIARVAMPGHDPSAAEVRPPVVAPARYAEMELPEVFVDGDGMHWLTFSSGESGDHHPATGGKGGLQLMPLRRSGSEPVWWADPERVMVVLPALSGIYGARIVPEQGGMVVGFDVARGGFAVSAANVPGLRRTL